MKQKRPATVLHRSPQNTGDVRVNMLRAETSLTEIPMPSILLLTTTFLKQKSRPGYDCALQ